MKVDEADPGALDIGQLFAQGMSGPARPREVPSPADIDREAPHGRDDDGNPLAPYGWTKPQSKNDKPRPKLGPSGRKPAEDKPRLAEATGSEAGTGKAPAGSGPGDTGAGRAKLEEHDYTGELAQTSEAVWVGLSMLSMVPLERTPIVSRIPVGKGRTIGSYLKGANDKIAAQAHLFNANRGALVGALNLAANNSARARRLVEKLETQDATWCLMFGAMVMPFLNQSAALWGNTLEADGLPAVAELARANKGSLDGWIEQFNRQLTEATAEATAQAEERIAEAA